MEKILAIINPASNGGKTAKRWPGFYHYFINSGLEIEEIYTKYPGHAVEIAKTAVLDGLNYIMAVGGDGTINEIVNGVIENDSLINPSLKLIVFSQGTGSDLIRSLNISDQIEDVFNIIKCDKSREIDIIKAEYSNNESNREFRYFINAADCGMGAVTAAKVNKADKLTDGTLTYLFAVLSTLFNYKNKEVEIYADGKKVYTGLLNTVVAANGKYFGGGIKIAPEAELCSGKINVILLKDFSRGGIIYNLIKGYRGSHLKHPKVESFFVEKLEIYSKQKMNLEVDGENAGLSPALLSLIESKLKVLI